MNDLNLIISFIERNKEEIIIGLGTNIIISVLIILLSKFVKGENFFFT